MFVRKFFAGLKMSLITTFLVMIVLAIFLRYAIVDTSWEKLPGLVKQDFTIRMVIVLGSFCFLLAFVMAFIDEKHKIELEKKVAKFAEDYKVGDSFWAIHRSISLDDFSNSKALRNKMFHISIKEIKKRYFTIIDEFRPKWELARVGLGDFIIFENKTKMINYIKRAQRLLKEDMKDALESV